MARDPNDPVWDVYDELRTALLNVKYYSCRTASLQRQNFWIELLIAATATGSAVAGFTFWATSVGKPIWQALMVVSALLAIAKPLLRLTERIQTFQELVGDYRGAEYDLRKIEVAIKQRGTFDKDLKERFSRALDRMAEAAVKSSGEYRVHKAMRERCEAEVLQELPTAHFFLPGALV